MVHEVTGSNLSRMNIFFIGNCLLKEFFKIIVIFLGKSLTLR